MAKNSLDRYHEPVLMAESIALLKVQKGKKYIDATLGGGGHAAQIVLQGGELLGLDVDPQALAFSRKRLGLACPPSASCWKIVKANFAHLKKTAFENGFESVSGVLFDLGVSSHQLETAKRGFSFRLPAQLDMRMDPDLQVTARDLVNGLVEKELCFLFERYGEEPRAKQFARAITKQRQASPIETTVQLAALIERIAGHRGKTHPATRVFQALRIAVNDELIGLDQALPQAFSLLEKGGRLVVISFHSLEDRAVKRYFGELVKKDKAALLTDKPLSASKAEVKTNSRSRSAKLRAVLKK
ncbi:16S rRNA (cytosine(1402)-N(4))-methyltransferase RsmH [Patescibacteria group bacterium]|nr:16S rRNA (cytosine(1402)-N(4))-methyltransferase RsmH [Patescibacteria group bacterium]